MKIISHLEWMEFHQNYYWKQSKGCNFSMPITSVQLVIKTGSGSSLMERGLGLGLTVMRHQRSRRLLFIVLAHSILLFMSLALSLNPGLSSNLRPFMLIARNIDRKKNYAGGRAGNRNERILRNSRIPQGIIKPEHWTLASEYIRGYILAGAAFRSQRIENSKPGLTALAVARRGLTAAFASPRLECCW